MSATAKQIRAHSGHSHGAGHHHHHHDNTYLTSTNRNDAGVRITRLGLYVNLGMAVSKGIGGYLFNSQALLADAFHALTDLVSDFMTLATISVALRPPTARYPNGFGKVESFGSLIVSGLLLAGGVVMCQHAGGALYHQLFVDAAHTAAAHAHEHGHGLLGHSHNAADMIPNINAAWLAAGSIVIKEYLYRATMRIAKERKSSVLASNAVHHRVDSLTSIVALVAIGGSHIIEGATWLDPVGGLLVSLMVIRAGWANTRTAVYELCDATVDDDIKLAVKRAATKAVHAAGNPYEVLEIEGIKSGQNYLVGVKVAVPGTLPVDSLRAIEDAVRLLVGSKVRGVRRVRVNFVAQSEAAGQFTDEFVPADVAPRGSPEPESDEEPLHDRASDHGHGLGQNKTMKDK